jgi:Tol biopolymer transport system component
MDDLDRRLSDWMSEAGSSPLPRDQFEQAMSATARQRPRPRWLAGFGGDWVGTAAPRGIEWTLPVRRHELLIAAALALLMVAAIVGAAVVGARLVQTNQNALPKPTGNGLIAFAEDGDFPPPAGAHYGIYVVAENQAARRIIGADSDTVDRVCPAFSPDATRLAFGQVDMAAGNGDQNPALVLGDIDRAGVVSNPRTIPVGGPFPAPCPVWSPDGRRIAFSVPGIDASDAQGTPIPTDPQPAGAGAVWVVAVDSGQVTKLEDVWAGDIDWAPDGSQLAIATGNENNFLSPGGSILLYSVASGAMSQLPGPSGVTALAWSPDGGRIAYQRIKTQVLLDGGVEARTKEIWTIAPDGNGATLQTGLFDNVQGQGLAWSPDGTRIAYQRACAHPPGDPAWVYRNGQRVLSPCTEQTDVVLLAPGTTVSATSPVGSEVVLPYVEVGTSDPDYIWWPFSVSWSPDGQKLLYDAWGGSVSVGLVVVGVDGGSPPIVLDTADAATGGGGDYGEGGAWIRPFSSWGRQPGSESVGQPH